ncbi:uncharacterized protein ASPGLDRAFT_1267102 [Aspergillus glaucus CBS 516.65]|uniref:Uncharacterized protein n=1 Tax=Aspergillus glaucus CBS 516.65 TaxID=1160497 RepID=A0A1L9VS62_ASPGL|nr:hypothetical protein ASPGLDRAFT_1267102 [Aspergillus glaucus CBS 516.65]OJJ86753.1 hypothetical protein ASPGLDRAFT_1267102 [Aspergillus glaucus CBS 516.65]
MLANQSGHPLPITGIASTRISTIWQKSNRTKTLLYRFVFCYRDPKQLATGLVDKRRQGNPKAKYARQLKNGAINVYYQVRCEDGFEAIVWFAALGRAIFCTENVRNEVAVINYRARIPQSQYLKFLARVIMEQSPDDGLFWVCLVARSSSMFDEVYGTQVLRTAYVSKSVLDS